jgi:hypothetical protein
MWGGEVKTVASQEMTKFTEGVKALRRGGGTGRVRAEADEAELRLEDGLGGGGGADLPLEEGVGGGEVEPVLKGRPFEG